MNLDEATYVDRLAKALAEHAPKSVSDALSGYVTMRTRRLKIGLASLPDYEIQERGKRISALEELRDTLASEEETEIPLSPRVGASVDQFQAHLSEILTPTGWQEEVLPLLQEVLDETDKALSAGGEIAGPKALKLELEILIAFLHNVDRKGRTSRVDQRKRIEDNGFQPSR